MALARPFLLVLLAAACTTFCAAAVDTEQQVLAVTEDITGSEDLSVDLSDPLSKHKKKKKHKKKPFKSPVSGLFIQERASKELSHPGQHVNFGAIKSWTHVLNQLTPDRKLLLVVRHGQAWSNYWQDQLGPDVWYDVVRQCTYKDENGSEYRIFDAPLTPDGEAQVGSLHELLAGDKNWLPTLSGNHSVHAVISPLSRCLQTARLVLAGLPLSAVSVEELCRETLGSDYCDARHSVSDPPDGHPDKGPCDFQHGLNTTYPEYSFPVLGMKKKGLGMFTDGEKLWKKGAKNREKQSHQVKRATAFLQTVFDNVEEQVVLVITHSGFARSLQLAVGREPYKPQNAELVPVLVEYRGGKKADLGEEEVDEYVEDDEEEEEWL